MPSGDCSTSVRNRRSFSATAFCALRSSVRSTTKLTLERLSPSIGVLTDQDRHARAILADVFPLRGQIESGRGAAGVGSREFGGVSAAQVSRPAVTSSRSYPVSERNASLA